MDKCPECGAWRFTINEYRKEVMCYSCGYTKKLTEKEVERWLDVHDILPKLAESLRLRGLK